MPTKNFVWGRRVLYISGLIPSLVGLWLLTRFLNSTLPTPPLLRLTLHVSLSMLFGNGLLLLALIHFIFRRPHFQMWCILACSALFMAVNDSLAMYQYFQAQQDGIIWPFITAILMVTGFSLTFQDCYKMRATKSGESFEK